MKQRKSFKTGLVLMGLALSSLACFAEDNTLSADNVQIAQGGEGSFSVYLDNSVSICGFEFYLKLPEGVSIKYYYDEDEEKWLYGIEKGGRARTEHVLKCSKQENGSYYIFCYSSDNDNFYDSTAKKGLPLLNITLSIESIVVEGTYHIELNDIILNHNNEDEGEIYEYKPANIASILTVTETGKISYNVENSAITITSTGGKKLTKENYQSYVSSQDVVTSIDLSGAVLAEDITSADLRPEGLNPNALIILPTDSQLSGENIVVNGLCTSFRLTDGYPFATPIRFSAQKAIYEVVVGSSLGFKTILLPFSASVPEGFDAYEATSINENLLNMTNVNVISAGKPILLKNEGTAKIEASNVNVSATDATLQSNGVLVGTYATLLAPLGSYVLQNQNNNIAFYLVTEEVRPKVNPFRAYLSITGNNSNSIRLNFGDTTEKTNIEMNLSEGALNYNFNGVLTNYDGKGVFIIRDVNGKVRKIIK